MKKNRLVTLAVLLLIMNSGKAQFYKLGEIAKEKGHIFRGVASQVGNEVYTITNKGKKCYLHQCSSVSMDIESSIELNTGDVDLMSNAWDVVKVDNQLILIIVDFARGKDAKIYGRVIVERDGKIDANSELKLIGNWTSPVYNGKPLVMGKKINISASEIVEGLPTVNSKIFLYYKLSNFFMRTDNLFAFAIIDKDLNKLDEKVIDFGEQSDLGFLDPIMDVDGNFYLLPYGFWFTNKTLDFAYIYNCSKKEVNRKTIAFDKLKPDEEVFYARGLLFDRNSNLTFSGFYREHIKNNKMSNPKAAGFFSYELNVNGETHMQALPFKDVVFNTDHNIPDKVFERMDNSVDIGATDNFIIVSITLVGDKRDKDAQCMDYYIFRKGTNATFSFVNNYNSKITNLGVKMVPSSTSIHDRTENIPAVEPTFIEKNNNLFMVFAPFAGQCDALHLKGLSYRVLLINTFNLNGGMKTEYVYNIDADNPICWNHYKLNDGNYIFWGGPQQKPARFKFY